MVTQLQLRVLYSFHDSRTPGIIGFVMLVIGAIGDLLALTVLPPSQVVVGLGAVYGDVTIATLAADEGQAPSRNRRTRTTDTRPSNLRRQVRAEKLVGRSA